MILKPDAIHKGIVTEVLNLLKTAGLEVVDHLFIKFTPSQVQQLYGEKCRIETKLWMSSSESLILVIEGDNAIRRVKYEILGKYPEGLRGKYGENHTKNIGHAADTFESAKRELELVEPLIRNMRNLDQQRFGNYLILAISGMSESGKSTVGEYLDSRGIVRIKIRDIFQRMKDGENCAQDLEEYILQNTKKNCLVFWSRFVEFLVKYMKDSGAQSICLESLYGGGFGPYLCYRFRESYYLLYVDVSLEIRLKRQVKRRDLGSIDEAKLHLLPRDELKSMWGTPRLKERADFIIDNSGTSSELFEVLDEIIQKVHHNNHGKRSRS